VEFDDEEMLDQLALDIDTEMLKWINAFEIPALALTAVILARLAWLSKLGGYEKDFLQLLEHPKRIMGDDDPVKVVH
jgi:hypothetical protein